jgi:sulfatase modifying factor 1
MPRLLVLAALLFALPAQAEVGIEWVTVGDPGNACETQAQGCFGSVAYEYRISKYEITVSQYTEFLNSVAASDPNGLYNTGMVEYFHSPGITRSGSSGSFTYSMAAGREDRPLNFVSFYSALRFANWLHNGQPTGIQDDSTTEDGAYTMIAEDFEQNPPVEITRNPGATFFIPSEDEWYKAAYYDPGSTGYFDYPAGSDTETTCAAPSPTTNTANCDGVAGDLTDVGSYTNSPSPNGTFDQGGSTLEWNEAITDGLEDGWRCLRGSYFLGPPSRLAASWRDDWGGAPSLEFVAIGFRVASPVPPFPDGIPALSPLGLLAVATGLLGFGVYRRGRE